jgi:hypothetical protein
LRKYGEQKWRKGESQWGRRENRKLNMESWIWWLLYVVQALGV